MKYMAAFRPALFSAAVLALTACATESHRAVEVAKPASVAVTYAGPKSALIVGKFDNRSSYLRGIFSDGVDRLGGQAKTILIGHLQETGRFEVLDRDNMDELAREAKLKGEQQAPTYALAADLNRDGNLDLVTVNQGTATISVLLGNHDGSFQAPVDFPVDQNPTWADIGDFNADGKLDLAVSNFNSNSVSILLGNGDGTFQPEASIPMPAGPGSVSVADLNRDGKLDLVVANQLANDVSVLLGNGDGSFGPRTDYPVTGMAARAIVADFNQDNKLDIAVASSAPSLDVLRGDGNGSFGRLTSSPIGNCPYALAVGDLDRDGRLDEVSANNCDNTISVVLTRPSLDADK